MVNTIFDNIVDLVQLAGKWILMPLIGIKVVDDFKRWDKIMKGVEEMFS